MPILNAAMKFIASATPASHSVALITFANTPKVQWPLTKMTPEAKQRFASIVNLQSQGSTDLCEGIYRGLQQFSTPSHTDAKAPQRVMILLTDGKPTLGCKTAADIFAVLLKHPLMNPSHKQVQIVTMTLGNNVDADLMASLALQAKGKMYPIRVAEHLPRAFGDCLGTMLTLTASHVFVEVECGPTLSPPALAQSDPRAVMLEPIEHPGLDWRRVGDAALQIEFVLGSMYQGETRDVLFRIPSHCKWVVVRLRYIDASTNGFVTLERNLTIHRLVSHSSNNVVHENDQVAAQLIRLQAQKILAEYTAANGSTGCQKLETFVKTLSVSPLTSRLPSLKRLHSNMASLLTIFKCETSNSAVTRALSSDFQVACAAANVSLGTQQQASTEMLPDEDERPLLRRYMSSQCDESVIEKQLLDKKN
jgi:hypothetical protein